MTTFEDQFHGVLLKWLQQKGLDAVKVEAFNEDYYIGGYCETCHYEEYSVTVDYVDSNGISKEYEYYGRFSSLLEELLEVDVSETSGSD